MADFAAALAVWLKIEGGYSPDAGGTEHGIIQATYDHWRRSHNLVPQSILKITPTEVSQVLKDEYWSPLNLGSLPQAWATFLLIEGGNLPWRYAVKIAQNELAWMGLYSGDIDGDVGPEMIQACKLAPNMIEVAIHGVLAHYATNSDPRLQVGFRNRLKILRQAVEEG
jgi:lysozyme family protein